MKEKNKKLFILFLIFLIVLGTRLYFAFQTPQFNDDGYLNYRLVEHISETGKPLFYDQLSYNGRDLLYSPVYHYVLAFFDLFLPLDFVLKFLPNFFISLLVFVVFGLTNLLVKDRNLSMFVSLLSGFVPIVFVEALNNISVYSLVLPLVFYLLYLFIKINERKNIGKFALFSFFLAVLHPSAFLLLVSLLFFVILMVSEGIKINKIKNEVLIFSIFLVLFVEFLIYKNAFLIHGFDVIRNNVPTQVLASYFNFSFLETVLKVGFLLLIFGFVSIIWGWKKKNEEVMLLSSLILSTLLLLWFRLIKAEVGFMFLGIALLIVSGISFKLFLKYIDKTKFSNYKNSITVFSVLVVVLSLVLPSFIDASQNINEVTPTNYEILVLDWIRENSLPDVTILAPLEKGHLITSVAGKRNVIDSSFLLAPDTSERFKDIETIYSTKSEVKALNLIHEHNVDYIFVPIETELKFGKVKWLDDESCFEGIFFGTPKVYKVIC
ncbi:MAG: hypothetical protein CMH62_03440 [Nanoarchaeota archaeon]|nr:hypothetical protein [Nanoarchaeota archaeon]|tara:strand:+ start:2331 stop:3806 length:1476 start_codon:yes stop_codon:yes gene_type:complete